MRLGAWLMLAGIALVAISVSMSSGSYETVTECTYWSGCVEMEVFVPNSGKPITAAIGGFFFSGGFGAWVGAYDAETRIVRILDEELALEERGE